MQWTDFYDGFWDWSDSTRKSRISSLEDIGSGEEDKPLVLHGDFHFANFRYGDTSVSGIFDVMEFRLGYPAEDFIRLVLCSAERLRWYRIFKRGAIMKMFARLVLKTGYPCRRWEEAVDGYLLNKLIKCVITSMKLWIT